MILSTDLEGKRGENKKRQRQFLNLWRLFLSFLFEYNEGAYFITHSFCKKSHIFHISLLYYHARINLSTF